MIRAHGYIMSAGGGPTLELDTVCCAHCNRHYAIRPKQNPSDAGSWCGRCAQPICNRCGVEMTRTLKCRPFEAWLEQQEAQARLRRLVGF